MPRIVVYPEDLRLIEAGGKFAVELPGKGKIVAERFLDDNRGAGSEPFPAQFAGGFGIDFGRQGEKEDKTGKVPERRKPLFQSGEVPVVIEPAPERVGEIESAAE